LTKNSSTFSVNRCERQLSTEEVHDQSVATAGPFCDVGQRGLPNSLLDDQFGQCDQHALFTAGAPLSLRRRAVRLAAM